MMKRQGSSMTDARVKSRALTSVTKSLHLDKENASSTLLNAFSPFQVDRKRWQPCLPNVLRGAVTANAVTEKALNSSEDAAILEKLFPHTWSQPFVELVPSTSGAAYQNHPPLRLGVVLSGGQAPGGHNVISGLFDYVKSCNANSQLFGFLNGPWGIFSHKYMEISEEYMDQFRNQGGFDMICSGRHKIETEEQKSMSLKICKKLDLHGLVIIGGDDSNTNGAVLADYFKANGSTTNVIGAPKTIDGDLKNDFVEASFGFDTAIKVYSELIGNLTTDVGTSQNRYHFVRLMGRSASNIALECALQTRPNLTFIGEEVEADNRSLKSLVEEIVEMVVARHKKGMNYGIVLVPEGLIEFIPEVGHLIMEINDIVAQGDFCKSKLSGNNSEVFDSLPLSVQQELLLERDPHGNVQVAKIATEKLLMSMAEVELEKRDPACAAKFIGSAHYFGYEGRCAMPSNFDANYCYALGHTAGALVDNGVTACMAVVRHLHLPAEEWKPAGCPVTKMMNIERRKGKDVPVIKKYVVELSGHIFQAFKKVREAYKVDDYFRNPGPIQFSGPNSDTTNYSIVSPGGKDLLPSRPSEDSKKRYHFAKTMEQLSPIQRERLGAALEISPILRSPLATVERASRYFSDDQQNTRFVTRAFPLQCKQAKFAACNIVERASWGEDTSPDESLKIGVVLCGQQSPGASNVVLGLVERMEIPNGRGRKRGQVVGFKGINGLLEGNYVELEKQDLTMYANQGGFEMLGRTEEAKVIMRTRDGMKKVVETCKNMKLNGLVMIGGQTTLTDAAILTEEMMGYEQQKGTKDAPATCIVGVPSNQENNLRHPLLETCLGFDSTSKAFAALVGNLLTDAASATKYWYFVRLMGQTPSHVVMESALQTHPNFTVISEKYASEDETLQDVVQDIADVVCSRAEQGKNFGTVLVPEGLVHHLPQLRQLIAEVGTVLRQVMADEPEELPQLEKEFVQFEASSTSKYQSRLTPWSLALLKTLPEFFREQLVKRTPSGRIELSEVGTEQLLSVLVSHEMGRRKELGLYKGTFAPVCHYFGFQGRSTMPSQFDCCLGLAHGYLAGITVEAGLTGYMNSVRGLCGPPSTWKMTSVPISCLLKVMPDREMKAYGRQVPMVPNAEVDLHGKPYAAFSAVSEKWESGDHFSNPGPIQFSGAASRFFNLTLREDHWSYLQMLGHLEALTSYVSQVCGFGVDEPTLRTAVLSLDALKNIIHYQQGEPDIGI